MPEPLDETLRLTNCLDCGYALKGLPSEGICPECGSHYDQSVIVLHGWGRGRHENLKSASDKKFCGIAVVGVGCLALLFYERHRQSWSFMMILIVATLGYGIAFLRRKQAPLATTIRVLISPAGVQQLDGAEIMPPAGWADLQTPNITARPNNRARLKFIRLRQWWQGEHVPVDAEVLITPEGLAALRGKIDEFRSTSASQPGADAR